MRIPDVISVEAAFTTAQTDALFVDNVATARLVITQIQATCDNANTVDVGFRVGLGAAATPTTTGVVLTHPGVAKGSGVSRGNGHGILAYGAPGDKLFATCEVPTGGSVRFLVSYYKENP